MEIDKTNLKAYLANTRMTAEEFAIKVDCSGQYIQKKIFAEGFIPQVKGWRGH